MPVATGAVIVSGRARRPTIRSGSVPIRTDASHPTQRVVELADTVRMARPRHPIGPTSAPSRVESEREITDRDGALSKAAAHRGNMTRVLVVEDDRHVQRALVARFRADITLVVVATLREARAVADEPWDGMIVDRRLPDGDGLDWAKQVVQQRPELIVVLFTAAEPFEVFDETNRSGIIYAHKTDGIAVVKRCVKMWAKLGTPRQAGSDRLRALAKSRGLSKREHEVTELGVMGLTREDASHRLGIKPSTHRSHVNSVLRKLGYKSMKQLTAALSVRNDADNSE